MDRTNLKHLLDACFTAKRIVETLPKLPNGMKPRHIHVLDVIQEVSSQQGTCRVSDVSTRLNITMPSVTKLIQELERYELVKKYPDPGDKRVTFLALTESGIACFNEHVLNFHTAWSEALEDVSNEQAQEVIAVIEKLRLTMPGLEEK
ncbi:MAG: winged helix DNA-binding protein [Eubacterium sp.]|nr:winged helix DNA-binding protein [Eubacterium sp.]MCI6998144.1 winged helix DNA-binding protein [Eubacterium sp.]